MDDKRAAAPTPLEIALQARQFEIDLFWRRALFFWGFIAAAFIALATAHPEHPRLALAICCFGAVCSLCWSLVNRGSKYWHEAWEQKAKEAGGEPVAQLFEQVVPPRSHGLWSAQRFSVSRVAIALSDFTFLLWFAFLAYEVLLLAQLPPPWWIWGNLLPAAFVLMTLAYMMLLVGKERGSQAS